MSNAGSLLKRTWPSFFKGGVHPNEHKEETSRMPIQDIPPPKRVQIHLNQHIGEPAVAVVKRGDIVKRGQLIGEAQGNGVPVHASISGKIANVGRAPHPVTVDGAVIIIEPLPPPAEAQAPQGEPSSATPATTADSIAIVESTFPEDPAWKDLSKDEMLNRIKSAGVVGLGGAAFPTHRKLNLPPNAKVDTLILNGAECEPYLTSDHRVMLEMPEDVILGAWLIAKIVGVHKCLIGIEDNKPDAAETLNKAIAKLSPQSFSFSVEMQVQLTQTRYPQGSEKQLIQALTRRNVPARKLPMDVGVVVQNVATAVACVDAIRNRKPLLDRVVSVSGGGIKEPKNLRVPLGTGIEEIVAACGGIKENVVKVLSGGPMMGRALASLAVPIIKGTNGLLFLIKEETYLGEYLACIQCGECLDVCPLGLEPNRISVYVEAGLPLNTEGFGTHECFECGCCSYACPSRRPLVQFIQVAKAAYRRQAASVHK